MLDTKIINQVTKRDGRVVEFDSKRIKNAVAKAMSSIEDISELEVISNSGSAYLDIDTASNVVTEKILEKIEERNLVNPHIEQIQDIVEETLILMDFPQTAKHYILYRNERAQERAKKKVIPDEVRELVSASRQFFSDDFSEFIFWRSYSRWNDELVRRETWIETVQRYMNYMQSKLGSKLTQEEYEEIEEYILNMWSMPSMRLMWSAGQAVEFDNACAYNCSFIAPTELRDFAEILYLLMCGCGVGFSVEAQTVQRLPIVKKQNEEVNKDFFVIEDSKAGWADALHYGLETWFAGKDVEFDFSFLRPAGARLKTMGGRSAGPQPLIDLLQFTRATLLAKQGKRLSSLNVHDIICKIGECVVAGGVRRSSLISLSDLDDVEMRDAKTGHFYLHANHRQLANNSVAYTEKPSNTEFMREWLKLAESGSGERGIFNRASLAQQIPSRRLQTLKNGMETVGTNPCGEIILQSKQFCNLTEVVVRVDDTLTSVKKKIRIAAILGTYQSMLTYFPYLSDEWTVNCENERLLGVSVTGQWDSPVFRQIDTERWAKAIALETNQEYAKRFGIKPSTSVTCVKPSGTVSQLVNAASGCHPRYAKNYIRRVRISVTDPLFNLYKDAGYPYEPDTGQRIDSATTFVLSFPVKAPEGAITRHDISALDQLTYWKQLKEHFTEHNPSCTIYVSKDEWVEVGYWIYKNWEIVGGLSFLPKDETIYPLSPFEEITAEEREKMENQLPHVDFAEIMLYETDDNTTGAKSYACVGDSCEV